jgi:hypothetical protein
MRWAGPDGSRRVRLFLEHDSIPSVEERVMERDPVGDLETPHGCLLRKTRVSGQKP